MFIISIALCCTNIVYRYIYRSNLDLVLSNDIIYAVYVIWKVTKWNKLLLHKNPEN